MKTKYAKSSIIELLKSQTYLMERIPLSDGVGILLEKNTGRSYRYAFGVYVGDRIAFRMEKNNYDVALAELHSFLVKNRLIPKSLADSFDPVIDTEGIWDSPFRSPAKTETKMPKLPAPYVPPGNEAGKMRMPEFRKPFTANEILERIDGKATEYLPKFASEELDPSGFYAKGIKGYATVFSYDEVVFVTKESLIRWKRILFAFVLSIPERMRKGLTVPRVIMVTYDWNREFTIIVNELGEGEAESANAEIFPFSLCQKDDWFVSRPSLLSWIEDLFNEKGVHQVRSMISS